MIALAHTLLSNATFSEVMALTHDSAAGAAIAFDAITLSGVSKAQLTASDFKFI